MEFALGLPKWNHLDGLGVPACVSLNTMPKTVASIPRATAPVCVDGGGFTEVMQHGRWRTTPRQHAARMRAAVQALGNVRWVAPQDWMCEDVALAATGLTLLEHQERTVKNLAELLSLAPDLPWLPVLQGQTLEDYLRHVAMYAAHGVNLEKFERVGIGSVCRRQGTAEGVQIIAALIRRLRVQVHAFGFKKNGLAALRSMLRDDEWARLSADSMAWSRQARLARVLLPGHDRPGPGRRFGHKTCANCPVYAMAWREQLLTDVEAAPRRRLFQDEPRRYTWMWELIGQLSQEDMPA